MKHEKIIVRENGDKVRIETYFMMVNDLPRFYIYLYVLPKGKRNWLRVFEGASWKFDQLPNQDKKSYIYQPETEFTTPEEIQSAKLELWEKLKPV